MFAPKNIIVFGGSAEMSVPGFEILGSPKIGDVVYVSGKGGSGKSTFSKRFSEKYGYHLVHLDELIREHLRDEIGDKAFQLYKPSEDPVILKLRKDFIEMVHAELALSKKIILEGTIKDPKLVEECFGDNFTLLYVMPETREAYKEAVEKRFQTDLDNHTETLGFVWNVIDKTAPEESFKEKVDEIIDEEWKKVEDYKEFYKDFDLVEVVNSFN